MAEQVCMAWGAVKVRRGPRAKPPSRKCACGCGKPLRRDSKGDYAYRCQKSPQLMCACGCGALIRRDNMTGYMWRCRRKSSTFLAKEIAYRNRHHSDQTLTVRLLVRCARKRALSRGIPFSMTLSDLEPLPTCCPVLGTKLIYGNVGKQHDASATIDRINPSLGYASGNVRIISWRANSLKKNGTPEELAAVAADTARLLGRHSLKAVNA